MKWPRRLQLLIKELDEDEGNVPYMYDDATGEEIRPSECIEGQASIGRGHNLHARDLTQYEIDIIFKTDLNNAIKHALKDWPWIKKQSNVRQDAFVNLVFNMGNRLHQFDRGSLKKWKSGDYEGAADGFSKSKWARQVQPSRSQRIIFMIRHGRRPDAGELRQLIKQL